MMLCAVSSVSTLRLSKLVDICSNYACSQQYCDGGFVMDAARDDRGFVL